jgi:2,4-dienoyl-CoA reductase-like NADH-dependent reductase (Old Yellow Enzyme family)
MANDMLFSPIALSGTLTLRNRVVMAPMTTWSANDDLTVSDEEIAYYRARTQGVGMVITGCTHVLPNGIGFTHEFAATNDRFLPSLRKLADAAKSGGAPAILQIFHAGNKALADLIPGGEAVAPSSVPVAASAFAPAQTPRALSEPEILDIISAFGAATRRAIEAGFDGVELHGAHGFLIQNFLSPAMNTRTDQWGGSPENRRRFLLEVIKEVRQVAAAHAPGNFMCGLRLSPEEAGGYGIEDTLAVVDAVIEAGVSYLHASLGDILSDRPRADPQGATIVERIVRHVADRVPVIAAGGLRTPAQARQALAMGLSCVAVGQGLVMNPKWVELASSGRDGAIAADLSHNREDRLAIPKKLWGIIDAAEGWFARSDIQIAS